MMEVARDPFLVSKLENNSRYGHFEVVFDSDRSQFIILVAFFASFIRYHRYQLPIDYPDRLRIKELESD